MAVSRIPKGRMWPTQAYRMEKCLREFKESQKKRKAEGRVEAGKKRLKTEEVGSGERNDDMTGIEVISTVFL